MNTSVQVLATAYTITSSCVQTIVLCVVVSGDMN